MSPSMVRLGGILAFVLIAVVIIGAFLAQNRAVAIIFGLMGVGSPPPRGHARAAGADPCCGPGGPG
jgi:hypothetical protein